LSGLYDKDYHQVQFIGDNEWLRYADLAPLISRAYRSFGEPGGTGLSGTLAKILKFPSRKR
jgi:hypothetical protein